LVLSHKHLEDFEHVATTLEDIRRIVSLVYRIDPDAAFDLLKWRSQEANVKLRALAEQLFADFRAMAFYEDVPPRCTFDRLLLTAHQRVRASAARNRRTTGHPD
jgi:hypothetical protein